MISITKKTAYEVSKLIAQTQEKIEQLIGQKVIVSYAIIDSMSEKLKDKELEDYVLEVISDVCQIEIEDLLGDKRTKKIINGRFVFYHILHKYFGYKKTEIARLIGRNHASVIAGLAKFDNYYHYDMQFKQLFNVISIELNLKLHDKGNCIKI